MKKSNTMSDVGDLLNTVQARVDSDVYDSLQAAATSTGLTVSDILRYLIRDYLSDLLKRLVK